MKTKEDGKTTTVTGENSMGVAIPISCPNSHSYLGKSILISYGGMTVLAKINDIGVLSGRNFDLQPGIFRSKKWQFRRLKEIKTISAC